MKAETGIYIITNVVTGRVYVGSALNIWQRWRRHVRCLINGKHHCRRLQEAWNEYGEGKFELSTAEITNPETLIEREQHWIDTLQAAGPNGYNTAQRAGSTLGVKHRPETLLKISAIHKGKTISAAARAAVSAAHKGRVWSAQEIENRARSWTPERRQRRSEISKSIVLSEEARKKISVALKGRVRSPEWCAKISAAATGRKHSDEARAKMVESHKTRPAISEETRAKMALARVEYWKRKRENAQNE